MFTLSRRNIDAIQSIGKKRQSISETNGNNSSEKEELSQELLSLSPFQWRSGIYLEQDFKEQGKKKKKEHPFLNA